MSEQAVDEWIVVTFEEVLVGPRDLTYGVVQPGQTDPMGTPIVRVGNIRNGRVDTSNPLRIRPEVADRFERSKIEGGELLITLVGTVGETAIAADDIRGWNTARAVGVARIRADVGARWVARALKEPEAAEHIRSRLNTTVQATLNLKDLRETPITLPPLAVRLRIEVVADAIDDKIESNRSIDLRIEALLDAISVRIGDSLPTAPLRDIARLGKWSVNPSNLGADVVDLYSLPAFDAGPKAERVAASTIMSNKQLLDDDAILVSRLNPRFSRTWWVQRDQSLPSLASTEYAVLLADNRSALAGLWIAIRDQYFQDELTRRVTGTSGSHQRVRPNDVLSIEVPDARLISEDDRRQVLDLLELREARRRESDYLRSLRATLIPSLISGESEMLDILETGA